MPTERIEEGWKFQPRAELWPNWFCLHVRAVKPVQEPDAVEKSSAAERDQKSGVNLKVAGQFNVKGELFKLNQFALPKPRSSAKVISIPIWKRVLDIGCLLVALPTLLPLMLLIAAFIKIVSPGPIFFRQDRIGFMGRKFKILKFRSMKPNSEVASHERHIEEVIRTNSPMKKMDHKGDPRVIRGGSFLRSSGLDELPQLINVLKGEMSLVGPRPCTEFEFQQFRPWHKQRFRALPGLTGLWQVSGKNQTTFNEMNSLDAFYARNCSICLDIKIMAKTFPVLLSQVRQIQIEKGPRK